MTEHFQFLHMQLHTRWGQLVGTNLMESNCLLVDGIPASASLLLLPLTESHPHSVKFFHRLADRLTISYPTERQLLHQFRYGSQYFQLERLEQSCLGCNRNKGYLCFYHDSLKKRNILMRFHSSHVIMDRTTVKNFLKTTILHYKIFKILINLIPSFWM